MKTVLCLLGVASVALGGPVGGSGSCVDGKDNLIVLKDCGAGSDYAHFSHLVLATYDSNKKPTCAGQVGDVRLPGFLKLVSGQVTEADQGKSLAGTSLVLSYGKDHSVFFRNICKEGHMIFGGKTDEACLVKSFCPTLIGAELCNRLAQGGHFSISDLPSDVLKGITLPKLDGILSFLAALANGEWHIQAEIKDPSGATLACIKSDDVHLDS